MLRNARIDIFVHVTFLFLFFLFKLSEFTGASHEFACASHGFRVNRNSSRRPDTSRTGNRARRTRNPCEARIAVLIASREPRTGFTCASHRIVCASHGFHVQNYVQADGCALFKIARDTHARRTRNPCEAHVKTVRGAQFTFRQLKRLHVKPV